MTTTQLHLIRHGTTDGNVQGLFLGRTDLPLNEVGRLEAERVAERLGRLDLAAVWTSDLLRAKDTALAIAARQGRARDVRVDARLREMDLGDLDGRPARDVHTEMPELIARWRTDPSDVRMPGPTAETLGEVRGRAFAALEEVAAAHPGEAVAVVTHTFVLLSTVCHVLGVPLGQFRRLFVDRASLTTLDWTSAGPVLRRFNDTAHLA